MNTLDDLRRSLDGRVTRTSDGHGLVQAAREGATRIRRRRRIAGAAAAACLVVVAAAVVPVVVARQRADHPAVVANPAPYRLPGQVTLGFAGSKYFPISQSTNGTVQRLALRNRDTSVIHDYGGEVLAYDPGTYDPALLLRGERTTVSGHDAWLVADYRFASSEETTPVLGWQDPSGVWVLTYRFGTKLDRADLITFASAIRIGPPRPLTTPFQLASGPGGLPLTVVMVGGGPHGYRDATVAFGTRNANVESEYADIPPKAPMMVSATVSGDNLDLPMTKGELTRIAPIAGHPAWYGAGNGRVGAPVGGGHLLIEAGACTVQFISADSTKIGRDDLTAMAAAATYADCSDPSTWLSTLG